MPAHTAASPPDRPDGQPAADAPRPPSGLPADWVAWVQRAQALAQPGQRRILGLVGPPGAGKSTVAEALAQALNAAQPGCCQVVPMDGYHLAQAQLQALGRAERKGAPDTFDAAGYAALLRRLRQPVAGEVVYAPAFHRALEEPIAGAIAIAPEVPLLLTEGNYLLLDEGPWAAVRPLLDLAWYVAVDDALRLARLIARHVQFGRSPEAARAWVLRSDEANARQVAATRSRADAVMHLADG